MNLLKFERRPIQATPSCAMCGKSIKDHTKEEMKTCVDERMRLSKYSKEK